MQLEFLKKSFELGKVSHAYIFSGNNEEKKHQVLNNFLAHINIQKADIAKVVPLEGKSEISIAQIRDLGARAALGAWASPFKIFIIEQSHLMNQEAQSAFLKLLEEPKGDAIFFLLTEHYFRLLPTLRSRAQEIKFWDFVSAPPAGGAAQELKKLQLQSLEARFAYAKDIATEDSPEISGQGKVVEILKEWLGYLRNNLVELLNTKNKNISQSLQLTKLVQETIFLLETTNVNPRLALEQVLLEI